MKRRRACIRLTLAPLLTLAALLLSPVGAWASGEPYTPVAGSPVPAGQATYSAAFSPDGRFIALVNQSDDDVTIYSVTTGPAGTRIGTVGSYAAGIEPESVVYSPTGDLLAVADHGPDNGSGGSVSIFLVNKQTGFLTPATGSPLASGNPAYTVSFNSDGSLLALADAGGFHLYKVTDSTGALTQTQSVANSSVDGALFSPTAPLLLVHRSQFGGVSGGCDGGVAMYHVDAGGTASQVGSTYDLGQYGCYDLNSLAFAPDGTLLAIGGEGLVWVYSVSTGGTLTPLAHSPINAPAELNPVSLGPDGLLAISTLGTTNVALDSVDPVTGTIKSVGSLSGSSLSVGIAFSPDGALIASADQRLGGVLDAYSVAAPSASIAVPADGGVYGVGQSVPTSFSCADSQYAPGLASCVDVNHATGGAGMLDTSRPGPHTYTVTATSRDGLQATAVVQYLVAAPPFVSITTPSPGGYYAPGQDVATGFTCAEGQDGPGLRSCIDSNGANGGHGHLDTTTLGPHTYTVTAASSDGQTAATSLGYTVAAPPTAMIGSPASGSTLPVGAVVRAQYGCAEGRFGPGIASCTAVLPEGARVGTRIPGRYRLTVTATSADGQRTTLTVTYTVIARLDVARVDVGRDGSLLVWLKHPSRGALTASVHASPGGAFSGKHWHIRAVTQRLVRIPVSRHGRRLLRRHPRTMTLTLTLRLTPASGPPTGVVIRDLRLGEHLFIR